MLLYEGVSENEDVARLRDRVNLVRARMGKSSITTQGYDTALADAVVEIQDISVRLNLSLSSDRSQKFAGYDRDRVFGARTNDMLAQFEQNPALIVAANAESGYMPLTLARADIAAPSVATPMELPKLPEITVPNIEMPDIAMPDLSGMRRAIGDFFAPAAVAAAPQLVAPPVETLNAPRSQDLRPLSAALPSLRMENFFADAVTDIPAKPVATLAELAYAAELAVSANTPITITVDDIVAPAAFEATAQRVGIPPAALRRGLTKTVEHINTLNYAMRGPVAEGIHQLYEQGIPAMIDDAHRSAHEQQGARRRGNSNAGAGSSYHNYGLAVDVALMGRHGHAIYSDKNMRDYNRVVEGADGERRSVLAQIQHTMDDIGFGRFDRRGTWGFSNDPLHFTVANEYVNSVRSFVSNCVGNRGTGRGLKEDEVTELKVPEEAIPPTMRRATAAVRHRRAQAQAEAAPEQAPAASGITAPLQTADVSNDHLGNLTNAVSQNVERAANAVRGLAGRLFG